MRALVIVLLLLPLTVMAAPAQASSAAAEDAYQGARKAYYALKADPERRKFRHHWRNVARKFEQVASKYAKSARAPDALFSAAELLEELSRISMMEEDLQSAVGDYQKVSDTYPKSRLADDAALALGRIYAERLGQPEAARKVLSRGLERNPKSDRAAKMKALYASLAPRKERKRVPSPFRGNAVSEAIARAAEPSAPKARPVSEPEKAPEPAAKSEPVETVAVGFAAPAPKGSLAQDSAEEDDDEAPAQPAEEKAPTAGKPEKIAVAEAPRAEDPRQDATEVIAQVNAATAKERLKAARPRGGEITLAEQLGLKVRRVVIDAGHGGHDSGAIGPTGVQEKDVSLAIAKRLAEILSAAGLEVLLTRDDDTFVRLEDRARMANEARGDLFISVHCNSAASQKLRGVETYTLNTSSDRYSIRLAARENSSSAKGISDLQFILADLATKANTEESQRLAGRVQRSLTGHLGAKHKGVKDLGTKEALFYVLLGAKMPAILVETSFLSNPEDEKRLSSKEYQEDVAQAIAGGVQDFLDNRQRLAKVD